MSPSLVESRPSSEGSSSVDLPAGDGFVARLERAVAPYAHRFAEAPAVRSLSESLPIAFGVAALALVAVFFVEPFTTWSDYLARVRDFVPGAIAIGSVVMVLVLSFSLAIRLKYAEAPMVGLSFLNFWLMMPGDAVRALVAFGQTRGKSGLGAFATTLGASGIFTAIVVCLATAGAIELGRRRFGAVTGDVIGGLALTAIVAGLYGLHFSLASAISSAVSPLATLGDSLVALALITAIEAMLWLVGIHGPALLAAIVFPVYLSLQADNTYAFAHHGPIPHIVVVATFLFVFPGGAGATLPLVALLLRSRVPRLRKIAFATLLPSLINVNEPVIFGLPLAYNPVLAVPFVLAPVVLSCTTYAAMALGLVGRPLFYTPSMIPAFANVFLATLDWRACVLMAFNLVIAGAI
ncbi:MAG: system, lactose/cellobiose family subunit, partial [Candidatus Eremiobacteraeota bacterium]|nr:system, lactose/cellobiose family subunit [Candidatus Eremiobacteraeota bacterium]